MKLTVNGETRKFTEEKLTVLDLLTRCSVAMPDMVSVQVNRLFVDRSKFATVEVTENDEVDFLYFMGGGRV
jgi:sulfur carrier protein